jgi:hypothetical protein
VVRIRVNNYAQASLPRLSRAKKEAGRVLGGAGLRIVWLDCVPEHPTDVLRDPCQKPLEATDIELRILSQPEQNEFPNTVFGFAKVPALATVYYNYVLHRTKGDNAESEAPILLGCIIAHEIGHLLLGPKAHSAGGIMQPRWEPKEIWQAIRDGLLFTSAQSKSMRVRVQERTRQKAVVPPRANAEAMPEGATTVSESETPTFTLVPESLP